MDNTYADLDEYDIDPSQTRDEYDSEEEKQPEKVSIFTPFRLTLLENREITGG